MSKQTVVVRKYDLNSENLLEEPTKEEAPVKRSSSFIDTVFSPRIRSGLKSTGSFRFGPEKI
jgi:hypothetical protein